MARHISTDLDKTLDTAISTMILLGGAAVFGFLAWRQHKREKWFRTQGVVDLAGEASFPASDPPSWSGAHT